MPVTPRVKGLNQNQAEMKVVSLHFCAHLIKNHFVILILLYLLQLNFSITS